MICECSPLKTSDMKMKIQHLILALFVVALAGSLHAADPAPQASTPASTNAMGPKIQFDNPVYDWGKVSAGEMVKHTFIFTNTGDATLVLNNVQPSCGCTTAGEWSHQVEPGKTGNIPIQFNSGSYNGTVIKSITVSCNDKAQTSVMLQIKGTIWRPVDVSPQFAVINVPAESTNSISTTVKIVNNLDQPMSVSPPESSNKSFTATVTTNTAGKEYQVTISTVPPLNANVQSQISLKTSLTNTPVVNITAWANVVPVIAISPPQIVLPPGPLSSQTSPQVTIQNNGNNLVTFSEPAITSKDVELQTKETIPGRTYTATLTFPQGFELAKGQTMEFTVKSSHAQFPVIRVPVIQMGRPQQTIVPMTPAPAPAKQASAPLSSATH